MDGKLIHLFFLFFSLSMFCNAQISVTLPVERMIFQRNNAGNADIRIAGDFYVEYDSIMAKAEARQVGQGTTTNWVKINTRNGKPYFKGNLNVSGGWYKLYVKAYKNGEEVGADTVQRVGVGEVFVIAGQSNATGTTSVGYGIDATEDRANVMNWVNKYNTYNSLPIGFDQMSGASVNNDSIFIGPFQIASWCWGRLADQLVDSLNVPILFYGAGFGGTNVQWWKESANGENLTNPERYVQQIYNHPYGALGSVMKYYSSLTGLRAVLWHQGESDHGTSASTYQYLLESVIAKSRSQIESPTFAWVVARASYAGGGTAGNVILGQNQVISADPNVYAGPETDNLGGSYRSDNIHLDLPQSFISHANLWYTSIVNGFLSSSIPVMSKDLIDVDFICNTSSPAAPIELSTSGTYAKYAWSNRNNTDNEARGYASDYANDYTILPGSIYERLNWQYDSTSSISVAPGRYALNVTKASGKKLFSPIVNLNTFTLPTIPGIASSASQIRPGDSATLSGSNCNDTYSWSNVYLGNPQVVSPAVTTIYSVYCKTLHCMSSASPNLELIVSTCFPGTLNLTGTVSSTESAYQSQLTVNSIQNVNSPGKIDYTAAEAIQLNPGFQATAGTVFKASIQNCP